MQLPDGLSLLEKQQSLESPARVAGWSLCPAHQSGVLPFLLVSLHQHLVSLHHHIGVHFKTSYWWNFWVMVELLGPCILLLPQWVWLFRSLVRLGEIWNGTRAGSMCACQCAGGSQGSKAIFKSPWYFCRDVLRYHNMLQSMRGLSSQCMNTWLFS